MEDRRHRPMAMMFYNEKAVVEQLSTVIKKKIIFIYLFIFFF